VANWTPVDQGTYDDARIQAYSNCDEVELFLNGRSLGVKAKPADDSPRSWETTFEKGSLKAIARNKGKEVATEELNTAGEPARIILVADQSKMAMSWDDVTYLTATVVDSNGVICPNTNQLISFKASEPGYIVAVDNGDVTSHEAYQASERRIFSGRCTAIVKAGSPAGKIAITANSEGLIPGSVTIEIK
jgi:beta-galactosidase